MTVVAVEARVRRSGVHVTNCYGVREKLSDERKHWGKVSYSRKSNYSLRYILSLYTRVHRLYNAFNYKREIEIATMAVTVVRVSQLSDALCFSITPILWSVFPPRRCESHG